MTAERPHVYCIEAQGSAPKVSAALVKGCNGILTNSRELLPGPVVLWGDHKLFFSVLKPAIEQGRTWYYADHAYFGRGLYFRVTKDALQSSGDFPLDNRDDARFQQVSAVLRANKLQSEIKIQPPKFKKDGFILICPPSEALSERSGFKQAEWLDETVARIRNESDRRLVIRQKPTVNRTPAPLLQALEGAWCAVTYTSNVATEAMLGGYPCFTTGPHPANVFGNTRLDQIERPYLPAAETLHRWAAQLCASQWTPNEIARGSWFKP